MNLLAAWKKVLLFGLFGAAGCLAGWAVGEGYLLAARAAASAGDGQAGSLISKPVPASSEPPPLPSDFRERLEKAGAKSGDIQISLIWFNTNDLDLHCVDPSGFEINYRDRHSPTTGGELDVDRNAGCTRTTVEPVENIYWPRNGAPMGHYKVYLNFFERCPGAPDRTEYRINVLHSGERQEFKGTITKDETRVEKRLIYEFELAPKLELFLPNAFTLGRGARVKLPVAVRRIHFPGKLELRADNLPEGVTAMAGEIPAGADEGTIELKASDSAAVARKPIKISATGAGVSGSADPQLEVTATASFSLLWVALIGVWTALLAVGLCLALLAGQNRYLHRPLFAAGRIPLALVVVGAVAAGFVSGSVGQSLYSLLLSVGAGGLGFVIGWVLLGGLLGWGVSFFVANLDRKRAALAGLAGGLLGAVAYLVWSNAADWLGRFAGAAVLGFCIGLVVAVVEAAFRRAWLEVRFGERETIHVNLGPEPVKVGGDARACTVWARGAADVALRFFVRNGQVICEDAPSRAESVAGEGYRRTVGTVTVTVRTGAAAPPTLPATVPPATPTPLPPLPALPAAPPATPQPAKPPEATKPPAPTPVPVPVPAAKAPPPEFDDGLPMPMSPPPPARPAAKSILDDEGYSPPARPTPPVPPKPPVPAVAPAPVSAKAPATAVPGASPRAAKPPVPPPKLPTPVTPPAAPKPPVPGAVAKPPVPAAPTRPAAPTPPAGPTEPAAGAKPAGEACPTCGRIAPGRPGARYCMMCDKAY
jgi:hypothetical protein